MYALLINRRLYPPDPVCFELSADQLGDFRRDLRKQREGVDRVPERLATQSVGSSGKGLVKVCLNDAERCRARWKTMPQEPRFLGAWKVVGSTSVVLRGPKIRWIRGHRL